MSWEANGKGKGHNIQHRESHLSEHISEIIKTFSPQTITAYSRHHVLPLSSSIALLLWAGISSCLSCQGLVTMWFWPILVLWPSYNIVSIKESKYILLAAISPWVKLGQHLQEVGYKALVEERSNCHDCPWHCILNLDESSQIKVHGERWWAHIWNSHC